MKNKTIANDNTSIVSQNATTTMDSMP